MAQTNEQQNPKRWWRGEDSKSKIFEILYQQTENKNLCNSVCFIFVYGDEIKLFIIINTIWWKLRSSKQAKKSKPIFVHHVAVCIMIFLVLISSVFQMIICYCCWWLTGWLVGSACCQNQNLIKLAIFLSKCTLNFFHPILMDFYLGGQQDTNNWKTDKTFQQQWQKTKRKTKQNISDSIFYRHPPFSFSGNFYIYSRVELPPPSSISLTDWSWKNN